MKKIKRKKRVVKNKIHYRFLILALLIILLTLFSAVSLININKAPDYPLVDEYQNSPSFYKNGQKLLQINPEEIIEHGSRDKKQIALTFDADMTYGMIDELHRGAIKSWYNKQVIDYLTNNNTKATIFLTGLWTLTYPKEAFQIAQNPLFEIGNHTYSHPAFTTNCYGLQAIADSKDQNEILDAQKTIIKTTGVVPQIFRFPGGCFDTNDIKIVNDLGLKIVHWDVAGNDGFNENTQSIIDKVLQNTQNGSIIVLHLNFGNLAPKTFDAIQKIIPILKDKGFEFVKVSDLIQE